jgi:hypothetical protein
MITNKIKIALASILIISSISSCTKTEEKVKKIDNKQTTEKKIKKEINMAEIEIKDISKNILS